MELPVAFCDEMKRILGDEYEDYLKSMEGTRKFGLRVNTAKISVEDFLKISPFELTPIPYVKNGFYYDGEKEQPAKHPYYFAGLYYLQDPSAMTPASRLPIEENDVVLDLCAAHNNKLVLIIPPQFFYNNRDVSRNQFIDDRILRYFILRIFRKIPKFSVIVQCQKILSCIFMLFNKDKCIIYLS